MDAFPLNPVCEPLAGLLGTWTGEGKGEYPTIPRFAYKEEVRFWHVGKPFLAYTQRTWALDDGRPMHAEMGYWRPQPNDRLEIVLAHPTGIAEIQEGAFRDGVADVRSSHVVETASAKDVTALARRFVLDGDTLSYEVQMAAVGHPLLPHLSATLTRTA